MSYQFISAFTAPKANLKKEEIFKHPTSVGVNSAALTKQRDWPGTPSRDLCGGAEVGDPLISTLARLKALAANHSAATGNPLEVREEINKNSGSPARSANGCAR